MTPTGIELAARVEGEVRHELLPITGRLDADERRALTALLDGMLASPQLARSGRGER